MENTVNLLRWTARILGFLACGFFSLFLIGEDGLSEFVWDLVPTIIFIGLAVFGYVTALFKERTGGILMMIAGIGQGIYLLLYGGFSDIDAALIYMLPLLIPGFLFYFSAATSR